MNEQALHSEWNFVSTFAGIILTVILFVITWFISSALYTEFFYVGGGDIIDYVLREIVTPAIGGFLSITFTAKLLRKANLRIIFFVFSALVLMVCGAFLMLGILNPNNTDAPAYRWIFHFSTILTSIAGAYRAFENNGFRDCEITIWDR